jgi:hypothetical protein
MNIRSRTENCSSSKMAVVGQSRFMWDELRCHSQQLKRDAGKSIIINKAIQDIGLGKYQWQLFSLCGMGWLADK